MEMIYDYSKTIVKSLKWPYSTDCDLNYDFSSNNKNLSFEECCYQIENKKITL